jgi:hypothetical protein
MRPRAGVMLFLARMGRGATVLPGARADERRMHRVGLVRGDARVRTARNRSDWPMNNNDPTGTRVGRVERRSVRHRRGARRSVAVRAPVAGVPAVLGNRV